MGLVSLEMPLFPGWDLEHLPVKSLLALDFMAAFSPLSPGGFAWQISLPCQECSIISHTPAAVGVWGSCITQLSQAMPGALIGAGCEDGEAGRDCMQLYGRLPII